MRYLAPNRIAVRIFRPHVHIMRIVAIYSGFKLLLLSLVLSQLYCFTGQVLRSKRTNARAAVSADKPYCTLNFHVSNLLENEPTLA